MAPLSLSQLLDVAIGTPELGAVNFTALHGLLQALLEHLGLRDLPARAHPADDGGGETTSTPRFADVAAEVRRMRKKMEENESGISKATALSQDLLEQVGGMKAAQSHMEEDIQMIQEALGLGKFQDSARQLPSLRNQETLNSDVKRLKERLSLYPTPEEEGGGGQSGPAEPPASEADAPRRGSSALALKGPETQPVPAPSEGTGEGTSEGTPGTQPGSLEMQAGMQRASGTPEEQAGAPLDQKRTSDASTTTPGMQPETPSAQTTAPGMQPGSLDTQTTTAGMQPETPSTQTTTAGMQPETPSTQTTTAGMQPETPRTQTTAPGMQPETPSTQTTTAGMQPETPRTQTTAPGMQPETPSTQTTTAGMQPETPSTQTTAPGMQPETPRTQTTTPGMQPGSLDTQTTTAMMQPETPRTQTTTPGMQPETPRTQTTTAGMQPETPRTQTTTPGMQPETPSTQTTTPGMKPETPSTQTTTAGMKPETPSTQTTAPGMQPGTPSTQTTTTEMQPAPPGTQGGGAEESSPPRTEPRLPGAEKVPAEATPGALGTQMDATSPKERGKALPSTQLAQAGQPAAGTLSPTETPLDAEATSPSQEPAVPWGSLSSSNAYDRYAETVEALRQIGQLGHLYTSLKEQVVQLEATKLDHSELEKLRQLFPKGDQESIPSILADLRSQMSSLQGLVRDLQGEKEKVRQLEDVLVKLGLVRADWSTDGRDQVTLQPGSILQEINQELKELGERQEMTKAALEQLVTRATDQLQEQLDKLRVTVESVGPEQAEAGSRCPACNADTNAQLGQLLQRYEKLQELVDSMSRQAMGKAMRQLPGKSQDEELLQRIQATIVQVQGDYEKLSSVMGNLLDDRHQKQKDIEALFQSLERLQKEKADKEDLVLGINVKADKAALASKVSRAQFDTSVERLNEMVQETLSRLVGQEQGCHQLQQQLSEEMESKLDRLELGPFRQQLEEHWKSVLEQLKEKMMMMEGHDAAGIKKQLLAHFHCVSCDRPVSMLVPGPHIVAVPSMPPMPSRLSARSHTVLELEQTLQHRERGAEYGYPSVLRHCGGRHTLTYPLQRCSRLQSGATRLSQAPAVPHVKDKMDLLGQDGHIYRGQRTGWPTLASKEGFARDKPKLSPQPWDTRDTSRLLSRPQSTGSLLSQPGTAAQPEQRPASSHGHPSQAPGLLPPLQPPRDGSSTPTAGHDRGAPARPPPTRPPSRRASGQQQ
ncbi:glutamine-rich protein 2 isoform 2-T2 [Chlamydotis macqueenii]